jgi:hypothetical protein
MISKVVHGFLSVLLVGCLSLSVHGGVIQWNAVDLNGKKISNAFIDVISGGIIITSGGTSSGSGPNSLSFNSAALRGVDSPVTLRFRAVGREEASLFNILGDSNQDISVVLPKVYGAPSQCSPQDCLSRCRAFRRCR